MSINSVKEGFLNRLVDKSWYVACMEAGWIGDSKSLLLILAMTIWNKGTKLLCDSDELSLFDVLQSTRSNGNMNGPFNSNSDISFFFSFRYHLLCISHGFFFPLDYQIEWAHSPNEFGRSCHSIVSQWTFQSCVYLHCDGSCGWNTSWNLGSFNGITKSWFDVVFVWFGTEATHASWSMLFFFGESTIGFGSLDWSFDQLFRGIDAIARGFRLRLWITSTSRLMYVNYCLDGVPWIACFFVICVICCDYCYCNSCLLFVVLEWLWVHISLLFGLFVKNICRCCLFIGSELYFMDTRQDMKWM